MLSDRVFSGSTGSPFAKKEAIKCNCRLRFVVFALQRFMEVLTMKTMTRILIADDHFTVRLGIEMLVKDVLEEQCTIKHAGTGGEVIKMLQSEVYDILITDMNMPEPCGLQLLEKALQLQSDLKVLVVSVNPEEFFVEKCFQLGAYGFIPKKTGDEEFRKAIEAVISNKPYITESQKNKFAEDYFNEEDGKNPFKLLSARELEVTMLLLKGNGILEIANNLSVSNSTASTFKARVFKKLNISSLLELQRYAKHFGLIDDDSVQY